MNIKDALSILALSATADQKEIKTAGYCWAKKKCSWYFRPADYKSRNKGDWDMGKIRDKYGSVSVNNTPNNRPALAH